MKKKGKTDYIDWGLDDPKLNAAIIEDTFESFGIRVKVQEIQARKDFIIYFIVIEKGNKIEDIKKLDKDIALALSSPNGKVKIQAPIPNSNQIGISLPKRKTHKRGGYEIVTAEGEMIKIKNLDLLSKRYSKKKLNILVDDAIRLIHKYKFDTVGVILFQKELNIQPKDAIVTLRELTQMGIVNNIRSEEGKPGVVIGDVDKNELKMYYQN